MTEIFHVTGDQEKGVISEDEMTQNKTLTERIIEL